MRSPAFALLLMSAVATAATAAPLPAEDVPPALRASLLVLGAEECEVRYAPGSLDRAAHVLEWLCELGSGGGLGSAGRVPLVALVMGRDEWQRSGLSCPYGLPCGLEPGAVALPAAGDAETVALWAAVLGDLPALAGTPLLGTSEEAASLAPADALAMPLLARQRVVAAGFAADEDWLLDLLAHVVFLDASRHGGRGAPLAAFWERVRRRADGQPAAAGLAGELARQSRLFASAQALAGSGRRLPVGDLRRMQKRAGGRLRLADLQAEWPHAFRVLPPDVR
jgi:hypothetical protein